MIEAHGLVKRYGSTMAVNDLSFSIRPGLVTGFLGPGVARRRAKGFSLGMSQRLGIALSELIPVRASLEEAFMELTRESVEYQAAGATR
jgi:ABC-type multidrug transport system ATPase subunit